MPFDGIFIYHLSAELNRELKGSKVLKVYQPGAREITVQFRYGKDLFISADPSCPYFCLSDIRRENPVSPPNFCMLLRKHLNGAVFIAAEQDGLERTVRFAFDTLDELGDSEVKYLYAEVMGRYSNLILTDSNLKILGAVKNENGESGPRVIMPGIIYTPIGGREKLDPRSVTESDTAKFTTSRDIVDNVAGISPAAGRSYFTNLADGHLPQAFASAFSDASPRLYYANGKPSEFCYMPLTDAGEEKAVSNYSEAVGSYYAVKTAADLARQRAGDLLKKVSSVIERVEKKDERQRKELAESEDADRYRLFGDLLTANLYRSVSHVASVTLENYCDGNAEIDIALDPAKDMKQNAAAYYKKYRKLKTASVMLASQLESNASELEYLRSARFFLTECTNEAEIGELRDELYSSGYLHRKKSPMRGANEKARKSEPLEFVSDSGIKVFVGKNNLQNDRLTFKTSRRDWLWLHVKDAPGSHTVICATETETDDKTLYFAASLAAKHSSKSGKVEVDCTEAKNVRRQPGGKPGMVFYTDYKTLIVSV